MVAVGLPLRPLGGTQERIDLSPHALAMTQVGPDSGNLKQG